MQLFTAQAHHEKRGHELLALSKFYLFFLLITQLYELLITPICENSGNCSYQVYPAII